MPGTMASSCLVHTCLGLAVECDVSDRHAVTLTYAWGDALSSVGTII